MRAREVLGESGPLARSIAGWEHRPSQLRMAELVERALEGEGVALIEAGTGTGKTLGYLVPAVLSDRRRIVISTGTRTLQDQIVQKDVPMLERALAPELHGEALPVALLKGLPNYVCLRRLSELGTSAEADTRPEIARMLPVIRAFVERSETGERSELLELPEDAPIWAAVQSGSETRVGARCRFYEECFVTRARRRAEDARIVVVNHHLFFADLALRAHGAGVIPDYDAVVFDEAHQIEDVATAFFGVQIGAQRIETLLRDAERTLRLANAIDPITHGLLRSIALRASEAFDRVPRSSAPEGSRIALPSELLDAGLRDALFALDVDLETLGDALRTRVSLGEGVAQMIRRIDALCAAIGSVAEPGLANVAWIQQRGRSAWIGASPVDVSALFRDEVLHRVKSLVFTSATLATGTSFEFTKRRLGIDFEVDEEILPSPFDHPSQSALYLPDLPDPRETGFLDHAARVIEQLVALTGGGAFVLCTSVRVMNELARRLRPTFAGRGLITMMQGEQPKNAQLDRFRAAEHAVLFATQSFWEGVDVPGSALRLVILDKLPFEVPSDPLVQARCARVEQSGESPFMDYLVPSAALALKQGFGRLIRTTRDRGIVALLDSRIRRKGYGKVFLRSLPEARRCTTFEEVEAFWNGAPVVASPSRDEPPP
jgi:ATP-dependent DNA helicase DinG